MTEHMRSANDDEALSALIDGTLLPDEADALRARMARDPRLGARYAAMERANRAVRDAYRGVVDEPMPESMLELLRVQPASDAKVVDLESRKRRRALPAWFPQAAAAGIALAIGLGLGFGLGQRSSDSPTGLLAATGPVASSSALQELLESAPSGEPRALDALSTAEARLTFRAIDGDWCRELAVSSAGAGSAALACRRDGVWRVELVAPAAAGGELYRPAAGGDAPFEEAVDALIDGAPLEAEAERALLERGWSND